MTVPREATPLPLTGPWAMRGCHRVVQVVVEPGMVEVLVQMNVPLPSAERGESVRPSALTSTVAPRLSLCGVATVADAVPPGAAAVVEAELDEPQPAAAIASAAASAAMAVRVQCRVMQSSSGVPTG